MGTMRPGGREVSLPWYNLTHFIVLAIGLGPSSSKEEHTRSGPRRCVLLDILLSNGAYP